MAREQSLADGNAVLKQRIQNLQNDLADTEENLELVRERKRTLKEGNSRLTLELQEVEERFQREQSQTLTDGNAVLKQRIQNLQNDLSDTEENLDLVRGREHTMKEDNSRLTLELQEVEERFQREQSQQRDIEEKLQVVEEKVLLYQGDVPFPNSQGGQDQLEEELRTTISSK